MDARRQLEDERTALENKSKRTSKEDARLAALATQIGAASSDIARLDAQEKERKLVEFTVQNVRGTAIQMRAKSSTLCSKVLRTFLMQLPAQDATSSSSSSSPSSSSVSSPSSQALMLRGVNGEKFAPDASLAQCNVQDGAVLFVTEQPPPATIMYRIQDSQDVFLEMRSKNSVRVSKVVAGWRANAPPAAQVAPNVELQLFAPAAPSIPMNEHLTLGEYGIKDGTTLRMLPVGNGSSNNNVTPPAHMYTAPPVVPVALPVPAVPALNKSPPPAAAAEAPRKPSRRGSGTSDLPPVKPSSTMSSSSPSGLEKTPSLSFDNITIEPSDAYRAKWAFETDREREMSLQQDDLLLVVRRKKEWWKGVRARDGEIGWFPSTRVVNATPEECVALAKALAKLHRTPDTIKRKERRAASSKSDAEKQLSEKFGAEVAPVLDSEAQLEVAELERLAAMHEADARRVVELMRESVRGRCGERGEIEYLPTERGHLVHVDEHPILLLHGDELELRVGDDHSLKIEVLLNTVMSSFAFPFVTEFDGDNACLVLVGDNVRRMPLTGPCTVRRNGTVQSGSSHLLPLARANTAASAVTTDGATADSGAPTIPDTPRSSQFSEVPRLKVSDDALARHAAWERAGQQRTEGTAGYFDVNAPLYREYLHFWVLDRLLRLVCEDVAKNGDHNLVYRSDAAAQCVGKLHRRMQQLLLEPQERASHDHTTKAQLVNSGQVFADCVSALFPVRASLLALQQPSRSSLATALRHVGERFMLIEGRLSAEAVLNLDETVRRPPRVDSEHADSDDDRQWSSARTVTGSDSEFPRQCVVKFNFLARVADKELSINKDDRIRVLYRINDEWLFGDSGTRQGRFPAAFVEFVDESSRPTATTPAAQAAAARSAGLMTMREEEEMLMDSDAEDDSGSESDGAERAKLALEHEAELKAKEEYDRKAKEESERLAAERKIKEESERLAAERKAKEEEAERKAKAEAAERKAKEDAERTAKEAAEQKAAEEAREHERKAVAAAMAAAAAVEAARSMMLTPKSDSQRSNTDSMRSALDGSEIDVAKIQSWRDVLNVAKLKPAEVDAYVAQFDEHAVELEQLYDLDIEVAKLIGIKAGHWLRLQKAIAQLKEAGFEPPSS